MLNAYMTEIPAFTKAELAERKADDVPSEGAPACTACFQPPENPEITKDDLSQLAARLTAQEVMHVLNIAEEAAKSAYEGTTIGNTIVKIHRALKERFGVPMKAPDIMEKHQNMEQFRQDPLYLGTRAIHERLYKALDFILFANQLVAIREKLLPSYKKSGNP